MASKKKKGSAPDARTCGNCGASEDPPDTVLNACARCGLVHYCSRACQVQHWKRKPGGHKQFCVTPEERRPGAQVSGDALKPTSGREAIFENGSECAICLESLASSSSALCTLPCSHAFHNTRFGII